MAGYMTLFSVARCSVHAHPHHRVLYRRNFHPAAVQMRFEQRIELGGRRDAAVQ